MRGVMLFAQEFCTILQILEMGSVGASEEATMDPRSLMEHPRSQQQEHRVQTRRDELVDRVAQTIGEDGAVEAPGGLRLLRRRSTCRPA